MSSTRIVCKGCDKIVAILPKRRGEAKEVHIPACLGCRDRSLVKHNIMRAERGMRVLPWTMLESMQELMLLDFEAQINGLPANVIMEPESRSAPIRNK